MLARLIIRNIRLYYREKMGVFFSMLGVIILLMLHFLIFGKMNADSFAQSFPGADYNEMRWLSDMLMFAAIIPISQVTISLAVLGQMVEDRDKKQLEDFLIMPINRNVLTVSYIVSSLIIGLVVSLCMLAFMEIYAIIRFGIGLTALQLLGAVGASVVTLIFAGSFILLILIWLKSSRAFGALSAIVGTMYGFLAGAYVPIFLFGDSIRTAMSVLPFTMTAAFFKHIFLSNAPQALGIDAAILTEIERMYGSVLHINGNDIPQLVLLIAILAYSAVFLSVSLIRFMRMKIK